VRVRLVIDSVNRQWIIGKMADRLASALRELDFDAEVDEGPSDAVDVNHWMLYLQPWRHYYSAPGFFEPQWRPAPTKHTAMITHVDDPVKVQIVRDSIGKILDAGICMSRMTMSELAGYGIDAARLTYVNPAHDDAVNPRRFIIGMTTKRYGDGRKREDDLLLVARKVRLDAFRFEIIGDGWEAVAEELRRAGAEVDLAPSDRGYGYILERLPHFDYYLYAGWDEGSMGTLDALAAGVKTIITPQGFHLDLKGGITHPFHDEAELAAVFQAIADDRKVRIDSVKNWTWNEYARRHASIWRALLEGRPLAAAIPIEEGHTPILESDLTRAKQRLRSRTFKSEFWPYFLESRRFWMRGKLARLKRWLLRRNRR